MKRWILNIFLILFIGIFLVSGYFLVSYFSESRRDQAEFDKLADIMAQATVPTAAPTEPADPDAPTDETAAPTEPPKPATTTVTNPETGEELEVLVEFAQLYEMNPDIVGWIMIPDTNINYPVMQRPSSTDYYLYRNYDGNYSNRGCIYVKEECDVFAPSDNLTIYGHRMKDGLMFNHLSRYTKRDYWEENRYITFNTIFEHHTYEICYVFTIESSVGTPFPYHHFINAYDEAEFDEYVQNCADYALYDTGITPRFGDKLITLSTCEYTHVNGRLVVVARRID